MLRAPSRWLPVTLSLAAFVSSPASAFEFVDVAAEAGIDIVNVSGDPRRWYIPESNGCGAAWLDYDGDADPDLFVGNGAGMRYVDDGRRLEIVRSSGSRLYRNDSRKGPAPVGAPSGTALRFTDVTKETGAGCTEWINGIATADIEGDGDPDVYLACFDDDVLLRNDGGRFVDVTKEAGLGSPLWGSSAAFGDADGDGALDLYVANYCIFDPEHPPAEGKRNVIEGVEVGWGPEGENKKGYNPGAPDVFYRGDGRGHFRDATEEAGFKLDKPHCSYAVVFADLTGDSRPEVMVANDMQPANLFVNRGNGKFADDAMARGFAFNFEGKPTGAMGLMVEDFDFDGDLDVFRTNFDFEANSIHVNDGMASFNDDAAARGLAEASVDKLGWGGGFFDADLDGDLDLLVANGHVYPQAKEIGMSGWEMPTQLYEAVLALDGSVNYADVTAQAGSGLAPLRSARGVAFADADSDGDVDACVVDIGERPRLLENRSERRGKWLQVRLIGPGTNRDAVGAVVRMKIGDRTITRVARTADGLYSANSPILHFGLGDVSAVDSIIVFWPDGKTSRATAPKLDTLIEIRRGDAAEKPGAPATPGGSR